MPYIPPRDEIELDLLDIWQDTFSQPKIGMLDTFDGLQSNQEQLRKIKSAIQDKFQRELTIDTMTTATNMDAIADILRDDVKEASFSCLVPLRETGSKIPIFCVHGAGGNVMIFKDLCKNLGDEQPFYGLQAKGLDGESEPLTTIEDMAKEYLTEIQSVRPHGPYIFSGMCLGGLVAYEMAQQVHANEEVALVILLDAKNPSSLLAMEKGRRGKRSKLVKIKMKLKQGDLFAALKRKVGGLTTKILKRSMHLFKEKISNKFVAQEKRFYQHIWDASDIARDTYLPKPYSGNILALLASEAPDGSPRDPKRGWAKLAPQIEVIKIPGRHDTVVREPQVTGLAKAINQRLEKIPGNH